MTLGTTSLTVQDLAIGGQVGASNVSFGQEVATARLVAP